MAESQQPAPIAEHHLTVSRTARYAVVGGLDGAVDRLWLVCHGYGQRAALFIRHFAPVASDRRRIVAPEALSRFYLELPGPGSHADSRVGASWMTREDRSAEISDYVGYLNALWSQLRPALASDAGVTVLGFSQGAATAARWAVMGEAKVDRLILWAGAVPKDLLADEAIARLRAIDLTMVVGTNDPYAPEDAARKELATLTAAGLSPRIIRYDGGHGMHAATLEALAD